MNSKNLASINWVFGVNRSALVRPAKTLYSSSCLAEFVQMILFYFFQNVAIVSKG